MIQAFFRLSFRSAPPGHAGLPLQIVITPSQDPPGVCTPCGRGLGTSHGMGTEWAIVVCGINDPVCQSAIPLRVFGSIEHLNELEQRNIGIRRGMFSQSDDLLPPPSSPSAFDFSPFTAAPLSPPCSSSIFLSFFFFRRIIELCHASLIFSRDQFFSANLLLPRDCQFQIQPRGIELFGNG